MLQFIIFQWLMCAYSERQPPEVLIAARRIADSGWGTQLVKSIHATCRMNERRGLRTTAQPTYAESC